MLRFWRVVLRRRVLRQDRRTFPVVIATGKVRRSCSSLRKAGMPSPLVRDLYPEAAEALPLVLDLGDLDPADLAGGRDMRAPGRLRVKAADVHDADILGVGRAEIGGGAGAVRNRQGVRAAE